MHLSIFVLFVLNNVDELPRGQENARRNDPFEMLHNLLKEVAALKEVVEKKAESRTENENVEGLREMTEKVRQVRQDFSGTS